MTPPAGRPRPKASAGPFIGMGAMVCLLFLYAASLRFAPWWIVAPLLIVWLVLFVLACRWFTPHPRRVLGAAVTGLGVWLVVAVLGGIVLGWSA